MRIKLLQKKPVLPRRGDRRGAAAAEFALILPVLTGMLLGTFQYGVLMWSYNVMLNAARGSARSLAVGSSNETQARATALVNLPAWVDQGAWQVTAQDSTTTGTNQVNTTIAVPIESIRVLSPVWFVPTPSQLSVTIVMQKES